MNETKIFKKLKPNGNKIEYVSECNTLIDPFVTNAIEWHEASKFTDKTVKVTGHMYRGCFIADEIEEIK